ncbi:MMPL family transporter [Actinomadura madurae]|uniref:MMPL family transporter n=1 Tax=Actinomadura madurae TaxID=1993 RepID=UPI0020D24B93|nr:MMPL family transporter [Actinomadura madurae]
MAGVVLLVTFGSLAAAGLPLLTALIGIGVSLAASWHSPTRWTCPRRRASWR